MSAIDDIAKKTIEEISAELAQIGGAHDEFIQQSQKARAEQPQSHAHAFNTNLDSTISHYGASNYSLPEAKIGQDGAIIAHSAGALAHDGVFSSTALPKNTVAAPNSDLVAQTTPNSVDFSRSDMISPEYLFLRNLKERVEVLFEGLGQTPASEAEERLELTLKFLEFLLATVQNRLENLPK
ncbi:CiaD-like domain-containing protein [Campylobacter sp. 19-13652]|uniref:CiaD-like domain-containing protein n=1 Tax=Campylobacter sp. 19-13652 TaxID=2840180 RepID=UPI001C75ED77|nr:hypothetical protein [Campylobacter sp. 19-13652]BCX79122.1 hypothetical protein LBC_05840 [Campylobacter sp. 19-13652]